MRNLVALVLFLGSGFAVRAHAQGGTIAGLVVDPAGRPVRDADVMLVTETQRARTDSAGRFAISNLDKGFYRVRVRRIGFMPHEITTDLGKNGKVELSFELKLRPAILDSVVVTAEGKCSELSFTGFNCRRILAKKGVYLTDDDLADRGAIELGDVFRDVDGFRIEIVPTGYGAKPRPLATRGARCLNALVNGRPIKSTNPLPRYAYELIAVEIYALAGDAPEEYQRYVWDRSIRQTPSPVGKDSPKARCSRVVYWTAYT
jgi:hypothetical protein